MQGNELPRTGNGELRDEFRKRTSGIIKAREDAEASIRKYKDEVEKILQRSSNQSAGRLSLSVRDSPRRVLPTATGVVRSRHSLLDETSHGPENMCSYFLGSAIPRSIFNGANIMNFLQAIVFGMLIGFLLIYARLKFPEWKKLFWLSKGIECEHTNLDTCKGTLNIVNRIFDELSKKSGRMVCAGLSVDTQLMSKIELETMLLSKRLLGRHTIKERVNELISLILVNPQWNIRALDSGKHPLVLNSTADSLKVADLVFYLYTDLATKPLLCRLEMAFWKVATLVAIAVSAAVSLTTIVYLLKNYKDQKEAFNRDCFDMIDRITDLLQHQKQDHIRDHTIPPYLALIHIHDTLIPLSKRDRLEKVWEKAREVIGRWESRVRQENQLIDGEEYVVWRWIGRLHESRPNTDTEE